MKHDNLESGRDALPLTTHDVDLDRVWMNVAAEIWPQPIGTIERSARRLLGSPGLARALVTTPSLVLSWLLASVALLVAGVVATQTTGEPWIALLLPALAGVGVAYAYGPGIDPASELGQTMAVSTRMVLLTRVCAVFGLNALLGLLATLFAPGIAGLTLGWLLPMAMIAALGLAAATFARSATTGVGVALAVWGLIVLGSAYGTRDLATAVQSDALLPLYALGTLLCGALTLFMTNGNRWNRGFLWS
jgi:hypothetical protein